MVARFSLPEFVGSFKTKTSQELVCISTIYLECLERIHFIALSRYRVIVTQKHHNIQVQIFFLGLCSSAHPIRLLELLHTTYN